MADSIELEVGTALSRKSSAVFYVMHVCYPNDLRAQNGFLTGVFATAMKNLRDQHGVYVPGTEVMRVNVQAKTARRALKKALKILTEIRMPVSEDIAAEVGSMRLGYPNHGPRNVTTAINEYALRAGRDADNIRLREWHTTRPVAHLALGLLVAVDWDRCQSMSLMDFMLGSDPVWVEKAVKFSNVFLERLICANVISDDHSPIVIRVRNLL